MLFRRPYRLSSGPSTFPASYASSTWTTIVLPLSNTRVRAPSDDAEALATVSSKSFSRGWHALPVRTTEWWTPPSPLMAAL